MTLTMDVNEADPYFKRLLNLAQAVTRAFVSVKALSSDEIFAKAQDERKAELITLTAK